MCRTQHAVQLWTWLCSTASGMFAELQHTLCCFCEPCTAVGRRGALLHLVNEGYVLLCCTAWCCALPC
jgi:hypothetical protein